MKYTAHALDPYTLVEAPSGAIGVVVQTDRQQQYTLGGLSYGAPYMKCFAVFPGEPLEPLVHEDLPSHLQPSRMLIILRPGQKARIRVQYPFGPIGSFVFENAGDHLSVRPAWVLWSEKKLWMEHTSGCDFEPMLLR